MNRDPFLLSGKYAFISGASRGIGKEIAVSFARYGADVAILGRNEEALLNTATEIQKSGRDCLVITADMANEDEVLKAADTALSFSSKWDILVNNAGIARKIPLLELDPEEWDEIQQVNLKSAWLLSRKLVPGMINRRSGKIINISSLGSFYGTEGMGAYAVSKSGMNQLTRTMAVEWGPYNIQSNAICPTIVNTDMAREIWDAPENREHKKKALKNIPAGRFAETTDVANLALFLASNMSDYINGLSIPLDGGRLASS